MLKRWQLLMALAVCLYCGAGSALAAGLAGVAADFTPLGGYLVMAVGDEYLIDQDASKGVRIGDVFVVVQPGRKIVHPVTKQVIGTLDEVQGVLRVTQVKSGYSYARPLGQGSFPPGAAVKRFSNLEGIFWDQTGQGEAVLAELQQQLPDLTWRSYAQAQGMQPQPLAALADVQAIYFVLNNERLEVRDPGFGMIRAYPVGSLAASPQRSAAPAAAMAAGAPVTSARPAAAPASSALEERLMRIEAQYANLMQQMQQGDSGLPYRLEETGGRHLGPNGLVYETSFPGFRSLGDIPLVISYADFAAIDDRLMLVATNGTEIRVFDVTGDLTPSGAVTRQETNQILAVQWWVPTPGEVMVIATVWDEELVGGKQRVEGKVYRLVGKELVPVSESTPQILGAFDVDGDGLRERLLGQNYDKEMFFGTEIYELSLANGKLTSASQNFDLPRQFTVLGSMIADVDADGRLETVVVRSGYLSIYRGQDRIYRSSKSVGGSMSTATYTLNPNNQDSLFQTVIIEVSPVLVDLDGGGDMEIMCVGSDRGFVTSPGIVTAGENFRVSVFKRREGMYVKGLLGETMDTPIQAMTLGANRVMFVSTEPPDIFGAGGNSHLLSFVLNKAAGAPQ